MSGTRLLGSDSGSVLNLFCKSSKAVVSNMYVEKISIPDFIHSNDKLLLRDLL